MLKFLLHPHSRMRRFREHLRGMGTPYLVLIISLLPAAGAYFRVRYYVEARDRVRFEEIVRVAREKLEERFSGIAQTLESVRGLILTQPFLTTEQWTNFLGSLNLQKSSAGIRDIGFARRVTAAEKHKVEVYFQQRGHHFVPRGEQEEYFPIFYLHDLWPGEQTGWGWDASSEPVRRKAMDLARDSGRPICTTRTLIFGATRDPSKYLHGFVLYLPVYRTPKIPTTLQARRAALTGFVFASFVPNELFESIFGVWTDPLAYYQVRAGEASPSTPPLYDGDLYGQHSRQPHSRTLNLSRFAQKWLVDITTLPAFEIDSQSYLPGLVLLFCLTISGALFGITTMQARAKAAAELSNAETRESEARMRALVSSMDDIVFEFDENGTFLNVWTADDSLLAAPRHELLGRRAEEFLGVEFTRPFVESFRRVMKQGKSESIEYALSLKGVERWFLGRIHPIPRTDGLVQSVCFMARDITARKLSEEALRKSETRLTLQNSVLSGMANGLSAPEIIRRAVHLAAVQFPDLQVVYWHLTEAMVLRPLEWMGPGESLASPTSLPLAQAGALWRILTNGESLAISDLSQDQRAAALRDSLFSNSMRALAMVAFPEPEGPTAVLSFASPNARSWSESELLMLKELAEDFAVALRAEQAKTNRQHAEQALQTEKERLAVTLRSIGDGVITTDIHGKVVLLNRAAEALTGWIQSDASGQPLEAILNFHDSPGEQPLHNGAEAPSTLAWGRLNNHLLRDRLGKQRIISASASPIGAPEGRILGHVLVIRDITEKIRLEQELLKSSKLESVGLLAGGIAHDFNNILSVILGNVSVAKMISPEQGDVFERLTQAEKGCLRARDLTHQLLTFSKGGAPVKTITSLRDLVAESTHFASSGSNVRCEVAHPHDLWNAEVDPGQISQVINNLVINALQAMPEGGVLKLVLANESVAAGAIPDLKPGPYVRISVIDTGTGIKPEHLARIFDPYFSTKQTGSGLGLATCYAVVQKHDGKIVVESRLGEGSTFLVYLPASPTTAFAEARTRPTVLPEHGSGRILIMDDEAAILEFAKVALGRLGYQVETARDGAEALASYRSALQNQTPYSAVIMDLTIPGGMGGKDSIKHLLQLDPKARAIVSSGYSQDPVLANFRAYGFRGMVGKPYRVEDLARVLRQVLREPQ